ncbi:MAG: hypothetical protein NZ482_10170, partial [Gloeomargarita sp. SKYG98]|nr:hypothetical protein [Gloeomargarita sp. SKYG98]
YMAMEDAAKIWPEARRFREEGILGVWVCDRLQDFSQEVNTEGPRFKSGELPWIMRRYHRAYFVERRQLP